MTLQLIRKGKKYYSDYSGDILTLKNVHSFVVGQNSIFILHEDDEISVASLKNKAAYSTDEWAVIACGNR